MVLTAEPGPAERYRRWLAVRRGSVRAVLGTRAAMFAPVHDLGLVVVWDDGDDLHAEPRAPYPHVRTVLALRSDLEGAALVVGGLSRTAEGAGAGALRLGAVRSPPRARSYAGPPRPCGPTTRRRPRSRRRRARRPAADPGLAHRRTRRSSTARCSSRCPRGGYVPGLACAACRAPARCAACRGPLGTRRRAARLPACRWCAVPASGLVLPGLRRPAGCGRPRSARRARPRSSAGPSRASRCARRAAPRRARRRSAPSRRWSSRRRGPSRSPRAATPRRCCSTGGRCSSRPDLRVGRGGAAPLDGRRGAGPAGAGRRPGRGARRRVATGPCRRWSAGTRPTFADRELAERAELRLPPDSPDGVAHRRRRDALAALPRRRRAAGLRRGARAGARPGPSRSGSWSAPRARRPGDRRGAACGRRGPQRAQGRRHGPRAGRPDWRSHDRPSRQRPAAGTAPITAVVFDLGGVLIDWDPRYLYRQLLATDEEIDEFLEEVGFDRWNHASRRRADHLGRRRRRDRRQPPAPPGR